MTKEEIIKKIQNHLSEKHNGEVSVLELGIPEITLSSEGSTFDSIESLYMGGASFNIYDASTDVKEIVSCGEIKYENMSVDVLLEICGDLGIQADITKTYKLETFKLLVLGEYDNEQEAIKELADKYMTASKSDIPGKSIPEIFNGRKTRDKDDIGKFVYLYVREDAYGIEQWVLKSELVIYPFKTEHWWDYGKCDFVFEPREFRYKIEKGQIG